MDVTEILRRKDETVLIGRMGKDVITMWVQQLDKAPRIKWHWSDYGIPAGVYAVMVGMWTAHI